MHSCQNKSFYASLKFLYKLLHSFHLVFSPTNLSIVEKSNVSSMNSSNCGGTILKAGTPSGTAAVVAGATVSRQRCCEFVPPTTADIEIGGPSDIALLDIRYDSTSPIPPDKNFL